MGTAVCSCISQLSCSNAVSKAEQDGMHVLLLLTVSMSQRAVRHMLLLLMVSMHQRARMCELLLPIVSMSQRAGMYVLQLLTVSMGSILTISTGEHVLLLLTVNMSQLCGMQEHPAFVVFSKGEQGGAALVRSILNRAVGAPQDAVKQVRHHTHKLQDKHSCELCTTLRWGDQVSTS